MTSSRPRLLLGLIAAVTLVLTVGGALGVWPTGAPASRLDTASAGVLARDMEGASGDLRREVGDPRRGAGDRELRHRELRHRAGAQPGDGRAEAPDRDDTALPARSGTGRRVVFDMSEQRVWLVGSRDRIRRTYPVSGSRLDNLSPGRYDVYSRSRHAVSYTYEETMDFMVRFTEGANAAIGFHDIPVDRRGRPVQTREQLGTPLSSGCVRQARPDAVALWRFADLGTRVVVTA